MSRQEEQTNPFQHPDESHQVETPRESGYQHGYDRAHAWVEAHRSSIINKSKIIGTFLAGVVLVIIVGVYGLGRQDRISYFVSYPLPLPAATVDGTPVWYRDYVQQTDYIERVMAYQNGQNEQERAVPQTTINTQAIDNVIAHTVLERAANKRDIEVSGSDVEKHYQATYPDEAQRRQLTDEYGVSEDILKQQIRYQIMLGKLEQRLIDEGKIERQSSAMAWIDQQVANQQVIYWLPHLEG